MATEYRENDYKKTQGSQSTRGAVGWKPARMSTGALFCGLGRDCNIQGLTLNLKVPKEKRGFSLTDQGSERKKRNIIREEKEYKGAYCWGSEGFGHKSITSTVIIGGGTNSSV